MGERQTKVALADRVHFMPNQQITKLEEKIKPANSILAYIVLLDAGVPEQEARKRLYQTLRGAKFFVDLEKEIPEAYFPKEQFEGLFSEKPIERSDAVMDLGLSYIYASFSMLIKPQNVAPNIHPLVKLIAKESLSDYLLPEIKKDSPDVDMEKVKDTIFAALDKGGEDEKPRFVASGGRFIVLLPNQTLTTAEFATGNEFDAQIRSFLVAPIIQRFIDLMVDNLMTSGGRYKVPLSVLQKAGYAKNKLDQVDLKKREEVLEMYLNSDAVFHFLASNNQRLIIV